MSVSTIASLGPRRVLVDDLFATLGVRASTVANLAAIAAGAALVGLLAQVSVPMWPVPITGQTLGVLLVGAALGARRGAAALGFYALGGLAGIPWFANLTGGPLAIFKPSFGYILGFILAAWVAGLAAQRMWDRRPVLAFTAFAGASLIPFLTGVPYMWWMLHLAGRDLDWLQTLNAGFTPFLVGGVIKAGLAALLLPAARRLCRR